MCFPLLSFLQLSNSSAQVLTWLINLVTAGGIIDYIVMCITYLRFYKATVAQGINRKEFPYYGYFQPYCAWIGLVCEILVVIFFGYSSFRPPSVTTFFSYYTMLIVAPILYFGWKLLKRTKVVPLSEVDLMWERPIVDAYEATFVSEPVGFWVEVLHLVGLKRGVRDRRQGVSATESDEIDGG